METKKTKKDIVKMLLNQNLEDRDEEELVDLLIDSPLSVDIDKEQEASLTRGDRAADKLSAFFGSWKFIIYFTIFLILWMIFNGFVLITAIDPFPFILLNLLLSSIAALQAPIIMMSQNRQAHKDSLRVHNDYRIDLKSELILETLHEDIQKVLKNQNKILKYLESEEKIKENK